MAEEWDFDLVLDLVGGVDPQWEAEAAVVRIGSRLRMVRLGARRWRCGPTRSTAGWWRGR
jgi:hypothetical protein